MVDVMLKGLSVAQLTALGDAALQAGNVEVAKGIYESLVAKSPRSAQLLSRLSLAQHPNNRTLSGLSALQHLEKIQPSSVFLGEGLATWLKLPPFMDDRRFLSIANKYSALSGVGGWHWNLSVVLWAAERCKALDGDFVELGVFKGHTTLFLAEYLEFQDWPKKWWLYDTFSGIPDDQVEPGWVKTNKAVYHGTFSYEEVAARFKPYPNITVTQGRVPEVLVERSPQSISFLHVDLNNPTAEIGALDALYERICPGGIIVFDDFGWITARAQYEAETAWFKRRGLSILALPTGQGLFIKP